MLTIAKTTAALLNERVQDFAKAREEMKETRYFLDWDEKRQKMIHSIGEIDKLIDTLVIEYNSMAKMCGVTNRKAIVRTIEMPLDKTEISKVV